MNLNGNTDYTLTLTEGAHGNSVQGGNGTITQTHYGNGYAKVTVGATAAAQIAQDGFLQINTGTSASDFYKYVMFIDDITVVKQG